MIECLYSLLIINNLSSQTKEMIFKIIKYIIESKKISQQIRSLIRLETNHIGFGGIISGMSINELNQTIVQEIIDLITTSRMHIYFHNKKKTKIYSFLRFINCCSAFKYCFNTL